MCSFAKDVAWFYIGLNNLLQRLQRFIEFNM